MSVQYAGCELIAIASVSGAIGDLESAKTFFELASSAFNTQQTHTAQLQTSISIEELVRALAVARPMLMLRRTIYPCIELFSKGQTWQFTDNETSWHKLSNSQWAPVNVSAHLWDAFYIRHLELCFQRELYSTTALRCGLLSLAKRYNQENGFSASAIVLSYLGSYFLKQRGERYTFQWGLAYISFGLFTRSESNKALVVCQAMTFRANMLESDNHKRHAITGSACLWISKHLSQEDDLLAKEFLLLAAHNFSKAKEIATRRGVVKSMRRKLRKSLRNLEKRGFKNTHSELVYEPFYSCRRHRQHLICRQSCLELADLCRKQGRPRRHSIS
jgi:hypothetical protein